MNQLQQRDPLLSGRSQRTVQSQQTMVHRRVILFQIHQLQRERHIQMQS
jgi:hypothetical protein